jgi:hypothetical protein
MAHAYHHALSSVKRWGGEPDDYLAVHQWFDETKDHMPDFRHRALRHHAEGIALCERVFGVALKLSTGRVVPVRWVAEQHVNEDIGRIPVASDWLRTLQAEEWMYRGARPLSRELGAPEKEETL